MDTTTKESSGYMESAKKLLSGSEKLSNLRRQFGAKLHFAVDNDVVMSYISPSAKRANDVLGLLRTQDGFSMEDQALSLAERVGHHVLFQASIHGDKKVFSLPGHHAELWSGLAGKIHAKLTVELVAPGSSEEVAEQIKKFRNDFYYAVLSDERSITLDDLVNEVPEQFKGWLGLGLAALEWQRLRELSMTKTLLPFPKEITDRDYLSDAELQAYKQSIRDTISKWRSRLDESHHLWLLKQSKKPTEEEVTRAAINIRDDAIALAFWERLNHDKFVSPYERLVLVTGSGRIMLAVNGVSATELGGDPNDLASNYLLSPFDFLDECHLHLTGELSPEAGKDKIGRLSTALKMLVTQDGKEPEVTELASQAQNEFGAMWGKFLRASVLERVQQTKAAHNKLLRQVLFVFSKAGISRDSGKDNPLVAELAKSGSEMLSEAADIRIMSLHSEQFTRGAPLLRLDKHPIAQILQTRVPARYCKLLTAQGQRSYLIREAGHRYTLHLLQARAMIWAGDWETALRLCDFSRAISDKLPPQRRGLVSDTDGREATFLAAFCVRVVGSKKRSQLESALMRAREYLKEFIELAEKAHLANAITGFDLKLHQLRARSEECAIKTTSLLARIFPDHDDLLPSLDESLGEMEDLLQDCKHVRVVASELIKGIACEQPLGKDADFLRYLCFRVAQQSWANELQIRISTPSNLNLHKTTNLKLLWHEKQQMEKDGGSLLQRSKMPDSWLIDLCKKILCCLLGKASPEIRMQTISALVDSQKATQSLFCYDSARFLCWQKLLEQGSP